MKLLLISGARIVGGAEIATLQLARAMLERGHRVDALCPASGQWRAALSAAKIPAYPARIGGSLNLLTPFAIAAAVRKSRPDLALVSTSDEWVWSCLMPRRGSRPRLVLIRHMGLALALRVRWLAGRQADAIVAVSNSVAQSLLIDSAISPAIVHVIPNATRFAARDAPPDPAERACARASMGLPAGGRLIGFLGGINLAKGVEDVIAAARRARQSLDEVHLLICGRPDTRHKTPGYEELARRHGMSERVHYLGHLDDVRPAIIASDVVAIATRSALREGLAQTAIDAMACGTPIAAYALGGVTDAVGQSEPAAVLARPDDIEALSKAVITLLTDRSLADTIARRGLARVREQFAPALMADRYEKLFAELIQ